MVSVPTFLMSDSSSADTTELILHNIIGHLRRLHREVSELRTDVAALQDQLSHLTTLQTTLVTSLQEHGISECRAVAEAERGEPSRE